MRNAYFQTLIKTHLHHKLRQLSGSILKEMVLVVLLDTSVVAIYAWSPDHVRLLRIRLASLFLQLLAAGFLHNFSPRL